MKQTPFKNQFIILFLFGLLGAMVRADGLIVIHNPPPGHGAPYAFAPLSVKFHRVNVTITDQVAVTAVDQSFYNPNAQRLEGTYLFPIPIGAQIDRFAMDIDGKMTEAELLDATKARQIYEDIVRKMRDPALLEYAGQGLFKVRIFPIEPRSEKRIKLSYTQVLRRDGALVEYRYPLNTEKFSAQPIENVAVKVELKCTQPIQSVYSPSHTVEIRRHGDTQAVIGYEASNTKPDTDFQLYFSPVPAGGLGLSVLTFNDGQDPEGGYFLLLAAPPASLTADKIVQKDVVFVLDTSGSMADDRKLDQAKRALEFCLRNLNKGDRFEVIRFSTEVEPFFEKLVPLSDDTIQKASSFIKELKPIGGTAIADALTAALASANGHAESNRPHFVVFLTDGKPTIGTTDTDQILARLTQAAGNRPMRVFCFGIGTDINTHLLDKLAQKTKGASQYILPQEDIELKVSSFYNKISQPVLANPQLKINGAVKAVKIYPAELPDLFRGEQLIALGRYSGSGEATITLNGFVNGQVRTQSSQASFTATDRRNEFIPRLWATRRVGYLLDQIRLNGESTELKDEVVRLARQYGIVTPYTAYLIVEDETHRQVPVAQRTQSVVAGDAEARAATKAEYDDMKKSESGWGAVGGAKSVGALKEASSAPAGYAAAPPPAPANQPASLTKRQQSFQRAMQAQASRYIRGRTFYQNGSQWIDANVQSKPNAQKVQVKFNSAEYFALMDKHPDARQWLSVGRSVQVLIGDTVYDVVE